jgi:hypothetical protein
MNNQKKDEFVNDIFRIQSFWGGYGEISPKTRFIQDGAICPDFLIQQTGQVPTVVTCKSLIVWSHFMDHRKSERVAYQFGIRDFQSFSQSETQM